MTALRPGPVDVHAHWLPEDLFGLPPGSPVPPLNGRDGQLHLGDLPLSIETAAMSDADRVLADTDAAGLGSRVISAPPFAFPVADAPGVDDYVGRFNDALARTCRDSGGRLLGLGLVSLHDADAARKQMDAIAASGVVRGIAVPPLLGATSFDVAPMRDVLRVAAEFELAVLVHPMQLPRPEWSSYYLANLIGNPVETSTAAAALVLGGVLEELPGLRICLLHGGGCAPALVGRWQHGWNQRADVRSAETRSPREGFARLWFDTLTHDGPALELLRAHADPARLMCGSDYPFDMGVSRPLDLPHAAGITDAALEHNAHRFLGLKGERDD
ncbi:MULTISPECIES: amidohydrolase family protein [Mycobacteriaceae]|uniref:amidohydrolase family protein n=1 Tax=Mycobacteriaceae TaxID=1762 RepID=UPI0008014232|nr:MULTISPECIES: amidohydrolase family protein [Mycobacteriaceae]MCK0174696.1 amidohydrolase [Mycolicibacterium sp. F2034L]OBB59133.1 2-hydroxy-3-carboxy-6-oxo-7-methylocta-2,4-dienoate decarboxylase [Mycobacterium sp. 852013-51886_SCH5428379]